MDKARVRSDLGTDGFDFQQLECTMDCFLLVDYSSFNKSYFLFRSWLSNSGTDDWIVNSLFFPIFGAHVVYVPPAVQQSQCSWVHGAKELDKLRGMLLVKCFIGGEDFPLISRTGTMSSGWESRPSFPEREGGNNVRRSRNAGFDPFSFFVLFQHVDANFKRQACAVFVSLRRYSLSSTITRNQGFIWLCIQS